jgi:PAS domain S-box-containing protein
VTGRVHDDGAAGLANVVRELSTARNVRAVRSIVAHAARSATAADGATFVLRDGDHCYYADEDAIAPLWRGRRFPADACISGWVMRHGTPAVIEDIYADDRIPHDAYRPTFVQSLVMVPVRRTDPIGAIGIYWAARHEATAGEIEFLQALADCTVVTLEHIRVLAELETRVGERTLALSELYGQYRTLVDTTPNAVVIHDGDIVLFANRAAAVLWGVDAPDDVIGTSVIDTVTPEDRDTVRALYQEVLDGGDPLEGHRREFVRPDGARRTAELFAARIVWLDRPAIQVELRDITDRVKGDDVLRALTVELSKAVALKNRVLATATHDMRNPLTSILGFVDVLQRDDIGDDDRRVALRAIERQGRLLDALVSDLLALSVVEGGELHLDRAAVDLGALVVETLGDLRVADVADVEVDVPPGTLVDADRQRAAQIVSNLATNACRYGGGHIRVSATAVSSDGEGGAWVDLRVRDDGPGVDPEVVSRLFEPFSAGRNGRVEGTSTGLGLSIVRAVARAHGGDAWLDAGDGPGACFVVRLPAAR